MTYVTRICALFLGVSASVGLMGCGPHLRATPDSAAHHLAGHWQATSTTQAQMAQSLRTEFEQARSRAIALEMKRMRRHVPSNEDMPLPPRPAEDAGPAHQDWRDRDFQEQVQALIAQVVPPQQLVIQQPSASVLEIQPPVGALRRLDATQTSTLVSKFSTLRIRSGWQDNEFVVVSMDSNEGMTLIERYRRVGTNLQLHVEFKASDIKKQLFTVTYQPAN